MITDASPDWIDAVFGQTDFLIRVLVMADGNVNFNPNPKGFSLTQFCDELEQKSLAGVTVKVTTAHRFSRDIPTGAELPGFRFDELKDGVPVFSIDHYDELWLFGSDGEDSTLALEPSELEAITTFMTNGGGVFATGDHEDLGFALCGKVPRVRDMRRWRFHNLPNNEMPAPARDGPTRIDSLRAGNTPGFEEGDQADNVPQEIRPRFSVNRTGTAAEPHPLLALGNEAITVLPDHMHEGECISPQEIESKLSDPQVAHDFPVSSDTGERVLPEIVAIATSAGGLFNKTNKPVEPKCYIVITAYDGHLVKHKDKNDQLQALGRVVVDASFHHFVNLNLSGFNDTENFRVISTYYRNTLRWLLPPNKQPSYFLHLLLGLRYSPPLLEEIQNLSMDGWEDILYAGRVTKRAIEGSFSRSEARLCALALVSTLAQPKRMIFEQFINIWQPKGDAENVLHLFGSDYVLLVVLGSVMLGMTSHLPQTYYTASEVLAVLQDEGKTLQGMANQGLETGIKHLKNAFGGYQECLNQFSAIL